MRSAILDVMSSPATIFLGNESWMSHAVPDTVVICLSRMRDMWNVIAVIKKLKQYDVLILRANVKSTFLLATLNYFHLLSIPFVAIAELNISEKRRSLKSLLKYMAYRRVLKRCDLVFPFSDVHGQYYHDTLSVEKEKLVTIPEAVDYCSVSEYPDVIDPSGDYIIAVGKTGRDFATLAKAIEGTHAKVVVVTSKHCVEGITFGDNVEILFDIPIDRLLDLISNAKYVVLPLKDSKHPVGLRLLFFAMERGKACIVTKTETIREYFPHDLPLKTVPSSDPGELRKAMEEFDRSPNEVYRLGNACRSFVEENYTSEQHIATTVRAITRQYCRKHGVGEKLVEGVA